MSDHRTSFAAYVTSIWTSSVGFFSTTSQGDIAFYTGITCAIGTFVVNWYYKRQHLKLIARQVCTVPEYLKGEV